MKLSKILEEAMGSYAPTQYPASSMAPRKDFVPFNKKDGYLYSRQQGSDFPPVTPVPPNPSSWPWELNGVLNDISDAFVFLEVALKKMSNCAKGSKVINKEQRQALLELYKAGKQASKVVKKIGMNIEDVGNIAGQPTPDASVPTAQRSIQRI